MFIAYVKQAGEGCDYTIACGETIWKLFAETREDAIVELRHKVLGDFVPDYGWEDSYDDLSHVTLFEVLHTEEMPLEQWYGYMKEVEEENKRKQEELKEFQEYKRLQEKYSHTRL